MDGETRDSFDALRRELEEIVDCQRRCHERVSLAVFQIDHHMTKLALAVHALKDALVDDQSD